MDEEGSDSVTIKVAGALSGVVRVPAAAATVGALRAEVARLLLAGAAGGDAAASQIKLICGGRTLADDAVTLSAANVGPASRVLVTRGAGAAAALGAAEAAAAQDAARAARLEKLKAAAERVSARGDGRGLSGAPRQLSAFACRDRRAGGRGGQRRAG